MAEHEDKVELLRKVDIFSELKEYELDIIARYSEILKLEKGEPVFIQDNPSDNFYVVDTGRVGIIAIESSNKAEIAQIVSKESFGELDFLGKTTRSASAFVEEDSVLLRFPAEGFKSNEIFHEHPYISACLLKRLLGIISERIWNVNNLLHEKSQWLLELRKQLLCDKMTGLYNLTFLKEDFVSMLSSLEKGAALLMIKPDNFKDINDIYGHTCGDKTLRLMAIFLQSELKEYDMGVRFRGDEFAAILINADKNEAVRAAKAVSNAYRSMDLSGIIGSNEFKIQVSIGIALYPDEVENSSDLIEKAHSRMMRARESGGNRIVV